VNLGDPIWPAPNQIEVPRLLGGEAIRLAGYPLHMVHAEKIVTAVQRGVVNTRWRDFGDVWTLSAQHAVAGRALHTAIKHVAVFRNAELHPLRDVLDGYPAIAQPRWALWRRKQRLSLLPADFADLLDDFTAFADPALTGAVGDRTWDPTARTWT